MTEKDFEQMERLLTVKFQEQSAAFDRKLGDVSAAFDEKLSSKIDEVSAAFDKKLDAVSVAFDEKLSSKIDEVSAALDKKLDALSATFDTKLDAVCDMLSKGIKTEVAQSERRLENLLIVLEKKVDLVIESQQGLVERIDRMELGQTALNHSVERHISNVAADLATHKADPAAHRRGYTVKEDEEAFVYPEAEGDL